MLYVFSCVDGHLKAREEALRSKRDIYVLGAANVGKSTFINYIIEDRFVFFDWWQWRGELLLETERREKKRGDVRGGGSGTGAMPFWGRAVCKHSG